MELVQSGGLSAQQRRGGHDGRATRGFPGTSRSAFYAPFHRPLLFVLPRPRPAPYVPSRPRRPLLPPPDQPRASSITSGLRGPNRYTINYSLSRGFSKRWGGLRRLSNYPPCCRRFVCSGILVRTPRRPGMSTALNVRFLTARSCHRSCTAEASDLSSIVDGIRGFGMCG